MRKIIVTCLFLTIALAPGLVSRAAAQTTSMQDMPNMGSAGNPQVEHSMGAGPMSMNSHMKMTARRTLAPGDQEKARQWRRQLARCAKNTRTTGSL